MLAEKLLAKGDYDCDKEIRTLELLKIRFGEANLLNCEASPLLSPQMLDGPPPLPSGRVKPVIATALRRGEEPLWNFRHAVIP